MKEWGSGVDTEGESEAQLYLSQSFYEDSFQAVPLSVTFAKKRDTFTVHAKVLGFFYFPRFLGACHIL